ncbi:MAG: DEAD/DEAH box helicase [Christensenellaceae bacterium]|jgi:DEAD/DEAH box helicase domain-containing protein|nr:DEAD/DEAH box helicase [Christensenellaceae bacterium]
MLPSILARQLQLGLSDYVKSAYPMNTPPFSGSLNAFLNKPNALFHPPYVGIHMPFRVSEELSDDFFSVIESKYRPYVHQQKAYSRLMCAEPKSTLIATGTGSGKTECFLYPILEYCYNNRDTKGIKALLIYPMNALANDQAKRIAELINGNKNLKDNVTAGLYIGKYSDGDIKIPNKVMARDEIITEHYEMLENPPDIILTNYKMLDYLLVRPKDAKLWHENTPQTLKFIVVDELHTFDGAQGTDLACLLRRLKKRLDSPDKYICNIGTSATLGDADGKKAILDYASQVFGDPFDEDSIITEERLTAVEFIERSEKKDFTTPDVSITINNGQLTLFEELNDAISENDEEMLLEISARIWLDNSFEPREIMSETTRLALGEHLSGHAFVQDLLKYMSGRYLQNEEIIEGLANTNRWLKSMGEKAGVLLDALYALISHARSGSVSEMRPYLNVRVQFWIRELRRMLATVGNEADDKLDSEVNVSDNVVSYALATDLNDEQRAKYLPVVNCRECGETGWVSIDNGGKARISDLRNFYNKFFALNKDVVFIYPRDDEKINPKLRKAFICPKCMRIGYEGDDRCKSCGSNQIPIWLSKNLKSTNGENFKCPHCNSSNYQIVGSQGATIISTCISQLYASKFNDDKKVITFSDNVQDAAHRAAFFNSRTWRMLLRSAIQKVVINGGDGLSLEDFEEKFVSHWGDELSTISEFINLFIPPNMMYMDTYKKLLKHDVDVNDKEVGDLIDLIKKRLKYEIMLEYGLLSKAGWTLAKTRCSVISFRNEDIYEIADTLIKTKVVVDNGKSDSELRESYSKIVIGFLTMMASNGAFKCEVLDGFTSENGVVYHLTNQHVMWLPGKHDDWNIPRFVHEGKRKDQRLISNFNTLEKNDDIYYDWTQKVMSEFFRTAIDYKELAKAVKDMLLEAGILVKMASKPDYEIWGISKAQTFISDNVRQLVCSKCGHILSCSDENSELWDGAPCVRKKCCGKLELRPVADMGYYGKLYSTGDLTRVIAKEHTSMLDRKVREDIEKEFKNSESRHTGHVNTLSCTPTLELGIDIGNLSSIIMCNVPPGEAQYLQRVGRSGRLDGNSLNVCVANANPYDLYFYANPLDMLAGAIKTPKIFLKATAVLERQFIAFCLDTWIKSGIDKNAIPARMSGCINDTSDEMLKNKFPYNFLRFISDNKFELVKTFSEMFSELEESEREAIRTFALGVGSGKAQMQEKIIKAFDDFKKQVAGIKENINQLEAHLSDLKEKAQTGTYETDESDIKMEQLALKQVLDDILEKETFGFLSDEGLLPNYAFPDSGIILKAILRSKSNDPARGPKCKVYEYTRASATAIKEFAPDNNFYVDGMKLRIDQVDLKTAEIEKWCLCPHCGYIQKDDESTRKKICPICGKTTISDIGQKKSMLKVQMVYSNTLYEESLIGDESDDRRQSYYYTQLRVVEHGDVKFKGRQMNNDKFEFAYDFAKKAIIREINFGEIDVASDEKGGITSNELNGKGFEICKHCGKIQPSDSSQILHATSCKYKSCSEERKKGEIIDKCLFLYRELETEVFRILIPATATEIASVRQQSFVAAFMLGMKEKFGNIDHLKAKIIDMPVKGRDYKKQYLVIYDSVPGGTGYLEQLTLSHNSLISVLEKALEKITQCSCNRDVNSDGCYHCLFAYSQSNSVGKISRKTAVELLTHVLSGKDKLQEIENLDGMTVEQLCQSELELNFIQAISKMNNADRQVEINKGLVGVNHGVKEGHRLTIRTAQNETAWEIEPQGYLDWRDGVSVACRPDFIFRPCKTGMKNKPIAIFTDGFEYHKEIVDDDTLKRAAIRSTNDFRVWTLSRNDTNQVLYNTTNAATPTLNYNAMNAINMYQRILEVEKAQDIKAWDPATTQIELLMKYLENPDAEETFNANARAYAFALLDSNTFAADQAFSALSEKIKEIATPIELGSSINFSFKNGYLGEYQPTDRLTIYAWVLSDDYNNNESKADVKVLAKLNNDKDIIGSDEFIKDWNGFWHFSNMIQFLKSFIAVTTNGIKNGIYGATFTLRRDDPVSDNVSDEWHEIIEMCYSNNELKEFAKKCSGKKFPVPVAGYELVNKNNEVIGEAEWGWEEYKCALMLEKQIETQKKAFIDSGWIVATINDNIDHWFRRTI